MEPVCYDIMEMIGKQYTIIKETNKNKKLYGEMIKHLNYYIDEYVDPEDDYDAQAIMTYELLYKELLKRGGHPRIDTQFLEYEDLWCSNHYEIIANKHGGQEEYDKWCDACF